MSSTAKCSPHEPGDKQNDKPDNAANHKRNHEEPMSTTPQSMPRRATITDVAREAVHPCDEGG